MPKSRHMLGFECCCCKELWEALSPFVKDCPVNTKEIRQKALEQLSFAIREFDQLLSWLPFRYLWVISLS